MLGFDRSSRPEAVRRKGRHSADCAARPTGSKLHHVPTPRVAMIGEKTRLAASLRALLAATVDYAGLFPPATLALEPALGNYAEYLRSDDAWMLGAFVLPVEQFSAAEGHLDLFSSSHA